MSVVMEMQAQTVAEIWPRVMQAIDAEKPERVPTRFGVSLDLPGTTLRIANVTDQELPAGFRFPEMVADYRRRLFGEDRERSLLYERIRHWVHGDEAIDQIALAMGAIAGDPDTRTAAFSLWNPAKDPFSDLAVSPIAGSFRLFGRRLDLFLTARSVDIWVGLVPELIVFGQLLGDAANGQRLLPGRLIYHAWSAHLYEVDYLTYLSGSDVD